MTKVYLLNVIPIHSRFSGDLKEIQNLTEKNLHGQRQKLLLDHKGALDETHFLILIVFLPAILFCYASLTFSLLQVKRS